MEPDFFFGICLSETSNYECPLVDGLAVLRFFRCVPGKVGRHRSILRRIFWAHNYRNLWRLSVKIVYTCQCRRSSDVGYSCGQMMQRRAGVTSSVSLRWGCSCRMFFVGATPVFLQRVGAIFWSSIDTTEILKGTWARVATTLYV